MTTPTCHVFHPIYGSWGKFYVQGFTLALNITQRYEAMYFKLVYGVPNQYAWSWSTWSGILQWNSVFFMEHDHLYGPFFDISTAPPSNFIFFVFIIITIYMI
jgi:hypothetical protein